ncbi:MAG: hypothetical protein ACK5OC_16210 [Pirellula sp.]
MNLCVRAGFSITDLDDYAECHWPIPCVSIEAEQIDRTVRLWISSAQTLNFELIEWFVETLKEQFPPWRIVLRLPRGDTPDAVVYQDCVRFGDDNVFSPEEFMRHKTNWVNAEKEVLPHRAKQFSHLNQGKPLMFLDNQRSIFLLGIFTESFLLPAPFFATSTLWFGCQKEAYEFSSLQIAFESYDPLNTSCPGGILDRNNLWHFASPKHAKYNCFYFQVETPVPKTSFVLNGTDGISGKPCRFAANLP